jgi:putative oxidoreductase
VRLIVGPIMFWHGMQKLNGGIPNFTSTTLVPLGIPYANVMGNVVTYTELAGGVLLVAGLLSRVAALALLIELGTTISLVKVHVGLIAPAGHGAGAELDLALAAGLVTIFLAGPGILSLDYLLRLETRRRRESPAGA